MNILQLEDTIKGLPDEALMQQVQQPSGEVPQYLVISEIQRRADMRKRHQEQAQEQPQGTVADQVVQEGIASMAPPPSQMQQAMNPVAPQMMYGGGVVRMEEGGEAQNSESDSGALEWLADLYTDPDGTVDWSRVASHAATVGLFGLGPLGWAGRGILTGLKYGPKAIGAARRAYSAYKRAPDRTIPIIKRSIERNVSRPVAAPFKKHPRLTKAGIGSLILGAEHDLLPFVGTDEATQVGREVSEGVNLTPEEENLLATKGINRNDYLDWKRSQRGKYGGGVIGMQDLGVVPNSSDDAARSIEAYEAYKDSLRQQALAEEEKTRLAQAQAEKDRLAALADNAGPQGDSDPNLYDTDALLRELSGLRGTEIPTVDYSGLIAASEERQREADERANRLAGGLAIAKLGAGIAGGDLSGGIGQATEIARETHQDAAESREREQMIREAYELKILEAPSIAARAKLEQDVNLLVKISDVLRTMSVEKNEALRYLQSLDPTLIRKTSRAYMKEQKLLGKPVTEAQALQEAIRRLAPASVLEAVGPFGGGAKSSVGTQQNGRYIVEAE